MQLSQEPENESLKPHILSRAEIKEHESAVIDQFCMHWKEGIHARCLNDLKSLPPLTLPRSIQLLSGYLLPQKRLLKLRQQNEKLQSEIQVKILLLMRDLEHTEATNALVLALFHPHPDIALEAKAALLLRGKSIVPSLTNAIPHSVPPHYWTPEGIFHILDLLRKRGDERASKTLLAIAKKNTPIKSNIFRTPFLLALTMSCTLGVLFMLAIGFSAPLINIGDMLLYLFMALLCDILGTVFGTFVLTIICSPFILASDDKLKTKFSASALNALAVIQDKRMLKELIQLTWDGDFGVKKEALEALKPLMPLVTKTDTPLSTKEEKLLNAALSAALSERNPEVSLSILHVLECLGTETSLQPLQRFGRGCKDEALRARAMQVYNALNARAELNTAKRVLLRASDTPDQTETLLRPAHDQHDPKEREQLLRPQSEVFPSSSALKNEEAPLEQRSE